VTKVQAYGFFSSNGGSGKTTLATAAAFAFEQRISSASLPTSCSATFDLYRCFTCPLGSQPEA
jgi:hypothetical protein